MLKYTYPTNSELRQIDRDLLPVLTLDDPIFEHFPVVDSENHFLTWTTEENIIGLQQARGLNGAPSRVKALGQNKFLMEPGVYGEFASIDEAELTTRAPMPGDFRPMDITTMVRGKQDQLATREVSLIRYVLWTLLTSGKFSVINGSGSVVHTDEFSIQTFAASLAWSTVATAAPLANFRSVQLLSRGTSCNFGSGAVAFMNRKTFNSLVSNTNTNDIAGRRQSAVNVPLNLVEINKVLMGEDLPQIVIQDDGYLDENKAFQPFIPDSKVVVVGRRPNGAALGEYRKTRNANNPNMEPGSYVKVVDDEKAVPRDIQVHRGHNGGPVIFYPNGVVVMSV